jgi:hypothetical protein
VMNRGDRREDIVRGVADRELFVLTLGEACVKCMPGVTCATIFIWRWKRPWQTSSLG